MNQCPRCLKFTVDVHTCSPSPALLKLQEDLTLLRAVAEAAEEYCFNRGYSGLAHRLAEWLAEGQEPVAWRSTDAGGRYRYRSYLPNLDTDCKILCSVPLFLHPAPKEAPTAQQDEAAPLSEWQQQQARIGELEHDLSAVVESVDVALERLGRYQCEGRSINSIHDVFEVLRLVSSVRATLHAQPGEPAPDPQQEDRTCPACGKEEGK